MKDVEFFYNKQGQEYYVLLNTVTLDKVREENTRIVRNKF
jgi:hypothetical protein